MVIYKTIYDTVFTTNRSSHLEIGSAKTGLSANDCLSVSVYEHFRCQRSDNVSTEFAKSSILFRIPFMTWICCICLSNFENQFSGQNLSKYTPAWFFLLLLCSTKSFICYWT